MTQTVDYRDVLREVCQEAEVVVDPSVDEVITALYRERLSAKAKPLLDVEQPVLASLGDLKEMGLRLGLISNCSVEEVAAWGRSPLAPLFDDVVFSYCVGYAKPDETVYSSRASGWRSCQRAQRSSVTAGAMSYWPQNGPAWCRTARSGS